MSNYMKQRSNNFIHPIWLQQKSLKKNKRHAKDSTDLEANIETTLKTLDDSLLNSQSSPDNRIESLLPSEISSEHIQIVMFMSLLR